MMFPDYCLSEIYLHRLQKLLVISLEYLLELLWRFEAYVIKIQKILTHYYFFLIKFLLVLGPMLYPEKLKNISIHKVRLITGLQKKCLTKMTFIFSHGERMGMGMPQFLFLKNWQAKLIMRILRLI